MKLHEITTVSSKELGSAPSEREYTNHTDFNDLKDYLVQYGVSPQKLGSGLYSVVVSDKDEPGTVKKVTYGEFGNGYNIYDLDKDAYFQYLMAIAKNERMSWNPYFPKVYAIKFFESTDGLIAYTVEMERLVDINKLSPEELMVLGNKMFDGFDSYIASGSFYRRAEILDVLLSNVVDAMHTGGGSVIENMKIKDSRLRHATLILHKLRKQGLGEDLHDKNIMFRRTPYGPQLVITDPFV